MGALNIPIIHARRVLSIAGRRIFLRKFCQNLQNAQFFRPKTGILPAILPSAAGQNFDTFSILHTVERGGSLQGRGNFTPSVKTFRFCQLPRGGSLTLSVTAYAVPAPPKGELFAICRLVPIKLPPSGELANAVSLRGFVPSKTFLFA